MLSRSFNIWKHANSNLQQQNPTTHNNSKVQRKDIFLEVKQRRLCSCQLVDHRPCLCLCCNPTQSTCRNVSRSSIIGDSDKYYYITLANSQITLTLAHHTCTLFLHLKLLQNAHKTHCAECLSSKGHNAELKYVRE